MTPLRFRKLWLAIGFFLVVVVMAASLLPLTPHVTLVAESDKLGHFIAYVAITFWFGQIYTRSRVRWSIAVAFAVLGVCLEYLQGMSCYRTFEYADIGANTAGVLCALLLVHTPLSKGLAVVERSLLRFAT